MVAIIKTGHSIHRIFNYNENKVKEGVAECIGAENYPVDVEKMNLKIKLNRLLKQSALNENVSRKSVHISLNFDCADTGLTKEKLNQIADVYMQKIGFGRQPYLVYQHFDAGHPHIHIVSIKVKEDGSRMDMQNIGRNQSEKARKEIEKSFGLIMAEAQNKKVRFIQEPVSSSKALYGKSQTKMAVQNVLENVLNQYKYTSFPELNVVLKQYNVMADRGSENSRIFKSRGLVYRILDEDGKPIGVPIKASLFYSKPTLPFLEEKFRLNESKRLPYKARIKNEIDKLFIGKTPSLHDLISLLERKGIHVSLRQNEAGLIYGITYTDHQTKCVFNGSALGKQYSAKAIQERCLPQSVSGQESLSHHPALKPPIGLQFLPIVGTETKAVTDDLQTAKSENILDVLVQPEQTADWLPKNLKRKHKKKKRKNISDNR